MSTAGLRKVGNYEEVLAQAIKEEQHINGIINPYLANAATITINNPEFQRVKDRLEDELTQQTKNHMDQTDFEHHVTNLAVDARSNRSDLDYIIMTLAICSSHHNRPHHHLHPTMQQPTEQD